MTTVFMQPDENMPQVVEERADPNVVVETAVGAREVKQVIIIRRDLRMRRGKEIAQGAHAAMAWLSKRLVHNDKSAIAVFSAAERQWLMGSFKKITLQVHSEKELTDIYDAAEKAGLEVQLITDAGFTEFHGNPTVTCLAIGPDYEDLIDPLTGHLSIY